MRIAVIDAKNGKAQLQVRETVASSTGGVAELFLGFMFKENMENSKEQIEAVTRQCKASHLVRETSDVEPLTGKWTQVTNPQTAEVMQKWQRTIMVPGQKASCVLDVTERVIARNQQVAEQVTEASDSVLD